MTVVRRLSWVAAGVGAPLLLVTGLAAASGTGAHPLSVLPNPAVVGDRLIAGGGQSAQTACDGDQVPLEVERDGTEVFAEQAVPNATGGWSIELPRLEAGNYRVTARCLRDDAEVFAYDPTTLLVQAAPAPSPSASVAPAPPASPVPGAPTFTG